MVNGDYDKARVPATRLVERRARPCAADRSQRRSRARSARRASPSTSTGPAPAPIARRPSRDGLRRRRAWPRARRPRGRRRAPAAPPASRSACSPSRARRRRGSAGPASSTTRSPSKTTSIACSRCPPVTTTARGPSAWTARASSSPSSAVVAGEHARLGEVGRDDRGARERRARRAPPGRPRRAAARRTRRPSPGRRRSACRPPAGRRPPPPPARWPRSPSIPTLTASTPMSSTTARTWATIIAGDTASTAVTADGVLRRDRRDRGRAVHAGAGEGLQVGLDPGAAAGVRAGDRQADGYAAGGRARRRRIGGRGQASARNATPRRR